jgi:tetratricopeptide (TPR) repeat protein
MSAAPQLRARKRDASSPAVSEIHPAAAAPEPEDPIQLLREAIERLKSSSGKLPDQTQVADLLAEAREALEHANVVARATAECDRFLAGSQFDGAFEALDAGLRVYPSDPALIARRREVEEQKQEFESAAAARTAIDEAQWLYSHDRVDLAVGFLESKAEELPSQPELLSRLETLKSLLPQWEQRRQVQAAIERAAALEQLEQGQAALAVLEEALDRWPASSELADAVRCIHERLSDHERQKKLARRLELLAQKIAAQSWREAAVLLQETQREFPDSPEVRRLQSDVDSGLVRYEREAIVAEVRRFLADGEIERAEQALSRGLESFGPAPALEQLREELESDRTYREALRAAQILFARLRLEEAEHVLTQIADRDRPEAQALLNAVREARAHAEEEDFCERGREKALKLIQEGQFAQASDLLRNLLSLAGARACIRGRNFRCVARVIGTAASHRAGLRRG